MKKILIILLLGLAPFSALAAVASAKFYYGGWIPYWNKTMGTQNVIDNFKTKSLAEISPFAYEVKHDGTLKDKMKIDEAPWPDFLSLARGLKIKILPSVALFDGDEIHYLLSNAKRRQAHEDIIAAMVLSQNFDGVDIDYEAKKSTDKNYFSTFIKGLAIRLHPKKKILSCTIEARPPAASLLAKGVALKDIKRANDYAVLNKYCDQIRVMAYDQGFVDLKLNETKSKGQFYAPVADPAWVKKVLQEALKQISPKKIMLGIPTYGYEYEVALGNGDPDYKRIRSIGFKDAMALATSTNSALVRNNAGELSFTYNFTAFSTRLVSLSDAKAMEDKIKLAKKLKLRGVFFFKLDGENDPLIWEKMK